MADELAPRRMARCARSGEGHTFEPATGTCTKCGLTVTP